jgi:hypothetical protein
MLRAGSLWREKSIHLATSFSAKDSRPPLVALGWASVAGQCVLHGDEPRGQQDTAIHPQPAPLQMVAAVRRVNPAAAGSHCVARSRLTSPSPVLHILLMLELVER